MSDNQTNTTGNNTPVATNPPAKKATAKKADAKGKPKTAADYKKLGLDPAVYGKKAK